MLDEQASWAATIALEEMSPCCFGIGIGWHSALEEAQISNVNESRIVDTLKSDSLQIRASDI